MNYLTIGHKIIDKPIIDILLEVRKQLNNGKLSHVEVAVRGHDHPVDAAFHRIALRDGIGRLDTGSAVGGAVRLQVADRLHDTGLLRGGDALQQHLVAGSVGDNGHGVAGLQFIHQHQERPLDQVQPLRAEHGAGDIDQEDQVVGRPLVRHHRFRLQAYLQQERIRVPGALRQGHGDAEGAVAFRPGIVIMEVIEHLFDAHRVLRDPLAGKDHGAQLGVGSGVHIRCEGGKRRRGNALEAVFPDKGVLVGVPALRAGDGRGVLR